MHDRILGMILPCGRANVESGSILEINILPVLGYIFPFYVKKFLQKGG
nr:MAG TPA: hypothetical protein [Caudoviricetes sp.]